MIININDKYRINFSDGRNYQPEFFSEGGESMTVAGRELVTKPDWKGYGKFFGSIDNCMVFVARKMAQEGVSSIDLCDYVERYEMAAKLITDAIGSDKL